MPVASPLELHVIFELLCKLLGLHTSPVLLTTPSLGFREPPKPSKPPNFMNILFQPILLPCQLQWLESTLSPSTLIPWLHILQQSFSDKEADAWTSVSTVSGRPGVNGNGKEQTKGQFSRSKWSHPTGPRCPHPKSQHHWCSRFHFFF